MTGWLSGHRVLLGWIVAAGVLYLARATPQTIAAGLPPALFGLGVRALAAGTLRKQSGHLTETGIYACTRNPLYLGSSLLTVGFAIMSGSIRVALLLGTVSALVYPLVIRNEESELKQAFGEEFDRFRNRVPCVLPRTFPAGILEGFSFRRYVANGEYNATLGFLAATALLALRYLLGGGP